MNSLAQLTTSKTLLHATKNVWEWTGMKWDVLRYDINIRIRKRLLLYRRISIDLYGQKTLFRNEHSHNFKASNILRLSHLWGNGFKLFILITSTTSSKALMKLETSLSAFLTSSLGYPFKWVPISWYSLSFPSSSPSSC